MDRNNQLGKRIKLRDLQILRAAAEAGSMVKAANNLAITQPAVSYAISELERTLGVPLLDRGPHGVSPTIYGRVLLDRSRLIFNELRQCIDQIGSMVDPSVGHLRIATTPPMSAIASAVFNRFVQSYPLMTFELSVGATDALLESLRTRDVELVISRLANFVSDGDLDVDTLFEDELAVLCGKRNGWAKRREVKLADLMGEPWVLPPPSGFLTKIIKAAFAAEGLTVPLARVTTTSTYALSTLVANGPLLAMHPRAMLKMPREHPLLAEVDVRLPVTRGAVGLITLKGRSLSPAANMFHAFASRLVKTANSPEPKPAGKR